MRRIAEVYAPDRLERIVVLQRADGRFKLSKEVMRCYEDGDEFRPKNIPFPEDGSAPNWSMLLESDLDSLFGLAADAEQEARRILTLI